MKETIFANYINTIQGCVVNYVTNTLTAMRALENS